PSTTTTTVRRQQLRPPRLRRRTPLPFWLTLPRRPWPSGRGGVDRNLMFPRTYSGGRRGPGAEHRPGEVLGGGGSAAVRADRRRDRRSARRFFAAAENALRPR